MIRNLTLGHMRRGTYLDHAWVGSQHAGDSSTGTPYDVDLRYVGYAPANWDTGAPMTWKP